MWQRTHHRLCQLQRHGIDPALLEPWHGVVRPVLAIPPALLGPTPIRSRRGRRPGGRLGELDMGLRVWQDESASSRPAPTVGCAVGATRPADRRFPAGYTEFIPAVLAE